MSGTVIVSKGKCIDVRNIDFEQFVEALRRRSGSSEVVAKVLQPREEFGMDMIWVDELSSAEFMSFSKLLDEVELEFMLKPGPHEFINQLNLLMLSDERYCS